MAQELRIVATTLGLYAAVVVTPGPKFALISRLAIAGARRAAMGAILGIAAAATFYAILTMIGLALALTRVGWLAHLLQMAGGCYLVYLGLVAWRSATPVGTAQRAVPAQQSVLRGWRMGVIANLSNPKGIAFFIGLYAVAVPPETALLTKLMILFGGFLIEITWYGLVMLLLSTPPARAVYDRFARPIDRAIGTVLAAFGLRLISETL